MVKPPAVKLLSFTALGGLLERSSHNLHRLRQPGLARNTEFALPAEGFVDLLQLTQLLASACSGGVGAGWLHGGHGSCGGTCSRVMGITRDPVPQPRQNTPGLSSIWR